MLQLADIIFSLPYGLALKYGLTKGLTTYSVCLSRFRGVDALEADLVPGFFGDEHHDGVPVGDPHHAVGESALRWGVIFWLSQYGVCVLPSQ